MLSIHHHHHHLYYFYTTHCSVELDIKSSIWAASYRSVLNTTKHTAAPLHMECQLHSYNLLLLLSYTLSTNAWYLKKKTTFFLAWVIYCHPFPIIYDIVKTFFFLYDWLGKSGFLILDGHIFYEVRLVHVWSAYLLMAFLHSHWSWSGPTHPQASTAQQGLRSVEGVKNEIFLFHTSWKVLFLFWTYWLRNRVSCVLKSSENICCGF